MTGPLIPVSKFWLRVIPHLAGFFSFILVLFCGLVAWDTLKPNDDVVTLHEGRAVAWNNDTGLVVMYERAFHMNVAGDGEVQRTVRCPPTGHEEYYLDGPIFRRYFAAGYYAPAKRPIQFSGFVPVGSKCVLQVWGGWRPRFAVTSKRWMLDELDFTVLASQPAVLPLTENP